MLQVSYFSPSCLLLASTHPLLSLSIPPMIFYFYKISSFKYQNRHAINCRAYFSILCNYSARLGYQSSRALYTGTLDPIRGRDDCMPRCTNADNRTRTCTVSNQNLNLTCLPIPPYQLKFILFSTIPYHKVYSLRQHELFRVAIFQGQAHQ